MTTPPKEGTSTRLQHPTAGHIVEGRMQFVYPNPAYGHHYLLQVQKLHLTRGAFLRKIPLPMHCKDLTLEGYGPADFVITSPFVRESFDSESHLINCPGFTDAELDLRCKVDALTKRPPFSIKLEFLKLAGCNNFTIGALKDIVKVGGMNSPWDFMRGKNLRSVEVSGHWMLAVEDGNWISDHLMYFRGMVSSSWELFNSYG